MKVVIWEGSIARRMRCEGRKGGGCDGLREGGGGWCEGRGGGGRGGEDGGWGGGYGGRWRR